jgi:hypothetical protein
MKYDNYPCSLFPRILGGILIRCGNTVYGHKPSYLKFRAVEVIARVPYHSWESAIYTLLTLFYTNEARALKYARVSKFARHAQDNETMHVVVISQLAKNEEHAGFLRHYLIPMLFAFMYFWASYWLYLLNARWSYELNYLFEQHAYDQYSEFVTENADVLKAKPVKSEFLTWYGWTAANQYEFFCSVRDDELMHRNASIEEIEARQKSSYTIPN